jgi:hypothetical protein
MREGWDINILQKGEESFEATFFVLAGAKCGAITIHTMTGEHL